MKWAAAFFCGTSALSLAAGRAAMCRALARRPAREDFLLSKQPYLAWIDEYRAKIEAGVHWIESAPRERWRIQSHDGLSLTADFYPVPNARGTVLAFHGYASDARKDFCCAAQWYAKQGFSVLLVQQRAHGESGGAYTTLGALERMDCRRWAQKADHRLGGKLPLVLAGVSMGATAVLTALNLPLPESVCAVVADCGFLSPRRILAEQARRFYRVPPALLLPAADFFAGRLAGFHFSDISTVRAMEDNRLPVFFLHGEADAFVPLGHTLLAYAACSAPKELCLVPKAVHTAAFPVGGEAVQKKLGTFLDRYAVLPK